MQRQEFLQQLWLDYIHRHPELGALRIWPIDSTPEYLALLTLNHGSFSAAALLPTLQRFGYRPIERYAMADRGLLVTLLAPDDDGAWLILSELQLNSLPRPACDTLKQLANDTLLQDSRGQNLLCRGRPWPMPSWEVYKHLAAAHPLAAWLAVMGPRLHHAGFDSQRLGDDLLILDQRLAQAGLSGCADRHNGIFPVSTLLDYRFYPTCARLLPFADGDEHRITLSGLSLVQQHLPGPLGRTAGLLLPQHARCELT